MPWSRWSFYSSPDTPYEGSSAPFGLDSVFEHLMGVTVDDHIKLVADFACGRGLLGKRLRETFPGINLLHGVDANHSTIQARREDSPTIYDTMEYLDLRTPGWYTGHSFYSTSAIDWDLFMFGDCLEHIPVQDAMHIIQGAQAKRTLLRIPVGPWENDGFDNLTDEFDSHKWTFKPSMLPDRHRIEYLSVDTSVPLARKYGIPVSLDDLESPLYEAPFKAYICNVVYVR